ncbi:hypothetical protein Nizo2776_1752 [Lactiplantibacillus plantarum]|nr:hypothetical protein Nizo2776_1752 [Lactiplantibacillus plantarum]
MCATQHGAGHRYIKNSVPMMRFTASDLKVQFDIQMMIAKINAYGFFKTQHM